eukprot:CAMPEP_0196579928 /NCGR_PEP_ID=MMETSP1081-20130531/25795_1 /TAXON_ID=36882 /ORGANISM="Pyramimonas amylifera, Strain CCMP720" /LENGTH=139 /DNA_ID=CAMNT_0041899653 /DNA_START=20 /DNA_END=436 /DNA_ORIENTATION=+
MSWKDRCFGSSTTKNQHSKINPFGLNPHGNDAPLLFVFDFDLTILRVHSFGSRIKVEDVDKRWKNDVADEDFFKQFLVYAQSAGARVAVASFGEYPVIQKYMDRIMPGMFTRASICTPSCVGGRDGSTVAAGKVPMIEW